MQNARMDESQAGIKIARGNVKTSDMQMYHSNGIKWRGIKEPLDGVKEVTEDWRRLLRCPWTARRSIQSILIEINPDYSLEVLLLKLQFFGHLVSRANSFEKTLMLGKIEGKRRRGWQRMKWFDSISDSIDMNLSKLWEIVKDRRAWKAAVHGIAKSHTQLQFSSLQSLSCVWFFVTPCTEAPPASLSITNSQSFLKRKSIESVMPFKHLMFCHPLLLPPSIISSIRIFSNESVLHIRWPKYQSFNFSISPSNEYSGWIIFRMDWTPWCPWDSQESSIAPQFKSISFTVLSFLYSLTLTSIHDYWKNHTFD